MATIMLRSGADAIQKTPGIIPEGIMALIGMMVGRGAVKSGHQGGVGREREGAGGSGRRAARRNVESVLDPNFLEGFSKR